MKDFELTKENLKEIENGLDDTAGYLVKISTIKFYIEKYVNEELKKHQVKIAAYSDYMKLKRHATRANDALDEATRILRDFLADGSIKKSERLEKFFKYALDAQHGLDLFGAHV